MGESAPKLDIKRVLRQNIWLIVGVGVFLSVPAVTVIWLMTPLEYVARAQLRFAASTPGVIEGAKENTRNYQTYVATQLAYITGPILQEVVEDPEVRGIKEIYNSDNPKSFLGSKLSVVSQRQSEFVDISVRMLDRNDAIYIVDLVVDRYMRSAEKEAKAFDDARAQVIRDDVATKRKFVLARDEKIKEAQEGLGAFRSGGISEFVLTDPALRPGSQRHPSSPRQAAPRRGL